MSVVGGELILQLVLVLRFGSGNRPAARVVLSPPELLVIATPEGSVLSHEFVFHLFREPRLVVSVDTDCPSGDARLTPHRNVRRLSQCLCIRRDQYMRAQKILARPVSDVLGSYDPGAACK